MRHGDERGGRSLTFIVGLGILLVVLGCIDREARQLLLVVRQLGYGSALSMEKPMVVTVEASRPDSLTVVLVPRLQDTVNLANVDGTVEILPLLPCKLLNVFVLFA